MGTAASSNKNANLGSSVVSPRVNVTKKGKNDAVLDSLPLSDVGPGTIHYRYKIPEVSVNMGPLIDRNDIRTGYFYHPRLQDFSEFGDPMKEETYKFIRVTEGPKKFHNKDVLYVSGIGFGGNCEEMPSSLIAIGPGVAQSKKKIYGHEYYLVSLDAGDRDDTDPMENGIIKDEGGGKIRLKEGGSSTIKDIKSKLGHHFLCPAAILHLHETPDDEFSDDQKLCEIFEGADTDMMLVLTTF